MKRRHLIFLGASCLFLAGCSEIEMRGVGPAGMALPAQQEGGHSRALAVDRPSRRQRRNAEWGRLVRPGENMSCLASATGGPCCDFPVWLREAQKFNGLYAGHDPLEAGNAARPRLFNNAGYNQQGENLALVKMWDHIPAAAQELRQKKYRIYDKRAPWSGVFAHWCLTHAINPKTGAAYEGLAGNPSNAENWLKYGMPCAPCLGALMVIKKDSGQHIAFCVGAILMPVRGSGDRPEEHKRVYLGFGGHQGDRVGMSAFAVSDIQAFRLPSGYQPCKEHFKLECSAWVEQFRRQTDTGGLLTVV